MRVTLTGDASLRRRPMRRVTVPLSEMGARFSESSNDGLPLTVTGAKLRPLRHRLPVSSAQIKSCLLLAGLAGTSVGGHCASPPDDREITPNGCSVRSGM